MAPSVLVVLVGMPESLQAAVPIPGSCHPSQQPPSPNIQFCCRTTFRGNYKLSPFSTETLFLLLLGPQTLLYIPVTPTSDLYLWNRSTAQGTGAQHGLQKLQWNASVSFYLTFLFLGLCMNIREGNQRTIWEVCTMIYWKFFLPVTTWPSSSTPRYIPREITHPHKTVCIDVCSSLFIIAKIKTPMNDLIYQWIDKNIVLYSYIE